MSKKDFGYNGYNIVNKLGLFVSGTKERVIAGDLRIVIENKTDRNPFRATKTWYLNKLILITEIYRIVPWGHAWIKFFLFDEHEKFLELREDEMFCTSLVSRAKEHKNEK